uniref:Uncharacterized protein n=1 Tax=Cacopsylla melanoneura TaxID=428564 RepID=A0A8D9EHC0_9HEMI
MGSPTVCPRTKCSTWPVHRVLALARAVSSAACTRSKQTLKLAAAWRPVSRGCQQDRHKNLPPNRNVSFKRRNLLATNRTRLVPPFNRIGPLLKTLKVALKRRSLKKSLPVSRPNSLKPPPWLV